MIIIGFLVLLLAAVLGPVAVLSHFSLVSSDVPTGVFLYGIVIGAAAASGAAVLFVGVCRAVSRGRDAQRQQARARRETAFINRAPTDPLQARDRRHTGTVVAREAGEPDRSDARPTDRLQGRRPTATAVHRR